MLLRTLPRTRVLFAQQAICRCIGSDLRCSWKRSRSCSASAASSCGPPMPPRRPRASERVGCQCSFGIGCKRANRAPPRRIGIGRHHSRRGLEGYCCNQQFPADSPRAKCPSRTRPDDVPNRDRRERLSTRRAPARACITLESAWPGSPPGHTVALAKLARNRIYAGNYGDTLPISRFRALIARRSAIRHPAQSGPSPCRRLRPCRRERACNDYTATPRPRDPGYACLWRIAD